MAPCRAEGTDDGFVFPAVTRTLYWIVADHVRYFMARCRLAKSSVGHQRPGSALWMAFQLDLDGDAASDVWLLQDISRKRGVAASDVLRLYEFCRRDGAWAVSLAGRVHSAERAGWGPLAVEHCPRELFRTGRVVLALAASHCAASRLCHESCWPQCRPRPVLVPMARERPYRQNRHWPVSSTLDVKDAWRHQGGRTGRTPHAHCDDYPSA